MQLIGHLDMGPLEHKIPNLTHECLESLRRRKSSQYRVVARELHVPLGWDHEILQHRHHCLVRQNSDLYHEVWLLADWRLLTGTVVISEMGNAWVDETVKCLCVPITMVNGPGDVVANGCTFICQFRILPMFFSTMANFLNRLLLVEYSASDLWSSLPTSCHANVYY